MSEKKQFPAFLYQGPWLIKEDFSSFITTYMYLFKEKNSRLKQYQPTHVLLFSFVPLFTYGVLSSLRNNSFPGNLFMSYSLVFFAPNFCSPTYIYWHRRKQHAQEQLQSHRISEYSALVPCVNILFLFMKFLKSQQRIHRVHIPI